MNTEIEPALRGILAIARESARTAAPLPGEHELARRLDVSRPHVRKLLAQLEQQAIVHRHQGAATTVDPVALGLTVRLEEQVEHTVLLERLGYEAAVEVVSESTLSLDAPLTEVLSAASGARALTVRKRWTADGRPAMLADNVLLLPEGAAAPDGSRSVFELVEELWGEPVVWEIATPGVESLASETAALLGLDAGAPCMTLAIVGVLKSGTRVFHAFERHHPDVIQYSVVRRFPEPWN